MVCSGILRLKQDRVEGLEQRKSIVNAKASLFTQKAVMEGKWREKKLQLGRQVGDLLVLHFRNDKKGKGSEKKDSIFLFGKQV